MKVKNYIENYDNTSKFFIKIQKSKKINNYSPQFDDNEIVGRTFDKDGNVILIIRGGM